MKIWVIFYLPLVFISSCLLFLTKPIYAQCVNNSTPRAINGLVSSQSQNATSSKFSDSFNNCVNDLQAAIPTFQILSFSQLKTMFYDQYFNYSGTTKNAPVANANESSITGWLNQTPSYTENDVTGDMTVGPVNNNSSGVAVVFVEGKLALNGNISNPNGGLVFVVKGDVNIDPSVTRLDAVIISTGTICTAYDSTMQPPCSAAVYTNATTSKQLVINGSLISLNQSFPIVFRRQILNNRTPAEVINQQPKYLVLLKYLLSQTLTITTINTNYSDQLVPDPTATPVPTPTATPNLNTVSVSPSPVNGGTAATVSWSVSSSTTGDYLALYSAGASYDSSWISELNTSCGGSVKQGSCSYNIPSFVPKGLYEMRYIANGNYSSPAAVQQFTINN